MRRAPAVLVALGAAVLELIIVAAAGNQWIVDHLVRNASTKELTRDHGLKAALTSFSWRFTSENHQRMLWLAGIVAAAGLVVAVFVLILIFVGAMKPPRTFFAVFLGAWGLVVAVTQIAAIGRAMLAFSDLFDHGHDPEGLGRWWFSIFHGPSAATVLFGGVSGLLVAILAGILASVSNSAATEPDETYAPAATTPDEGGGWQQTEPSGAWRADEPTRSATDDTAAWQSPSEESTRSWSSPTTTTTYPWRLGSTTTSDDESSGSADATISFPTPEQRPSQQHSTEPPNAP